MAKLTPVTALEFSKKSIDEKMSLFESLQFTTITDVIVDVVQSGPYTDVNLKSFRIL